MAAIHKDIRLIYTGDPAVIVVEPPITVNAVHIRDVVTRVCGGAVVADCQNFSKLLLLHACSHLAVIKLFKTGIHNMAEIVRHSGPYTAAVIASL